MKRRLAISVAFVAVPLGGSMFAVDDGAVARRLALDARAAAGIEVGSEPHADTLDVAGLERPVEVLVDRWGVSHIYAETEHDLFFAQGFNAARDRLFQFEIWRRQATGTVAEIIGERELDRDIGARLFRFRGDLEAELNHYHPRGAEIVRAFVDGINAYIAETERDPGLLPLEFEMLGIRPRAWTPDVVISRHQGLLGNIDEELGLGRAVARIGDERVKEIVYFHPGDPDIELDPSIDGDALDQDILRLYEAMHSRIAFQPEDVRPAYRASAASSPEDTGGSVAWTRPPLSTLEREAIGSNNWVLSGDRTLSGRTLMANDPHRVQQAPALRYMVHLVGPGWNVIGGGEPTIPGISIGHNEFGAWGLTVFRTDAEDLYVYETDPSNPDRYRYGDGWEEMRVITEQIAVAQRGPETVELRYTRHGPVVFEDTGRHLAFAVRAGWMEIGGAPYLASLRMDQATTWEEFRDACNYSHIPGENMVWADVDGNIGWQAVGIAPIRRNWSGLVPVPGDGRYEWDGFLEIKQKPSTLNPPSGYFATANENVVPRDYPHRDAVGWMWSAPFRGARLGEVLGSGRKFTMVDMMALQTDYTSVPARSLTALLRGLPHDDPSVEVARQMLLSWDGVLAPGSVEAGIYVAYERRIRSGIRERAVPAEVRADVGPLSMKKTIDWLASPPRWFGEDPIAGRDAFLRTSLAGAVGDLRDRLGDDMVAWRYGQPAYKHVLLRHPLSDAVNAEVRGRLEVGPLPRGGNGYTVNNTGFGDNQRSGASFRIIVEAGDWDAAVAMNNPGQSGAPDDPHYRDLFELWAADRFFPLYFSRPNVEAATGLEIVLIPEG